MKEKIELTADEKRNGWTEQKLAEYLKKRTTERAAGLDPLRRDWERPAAANSKYNTRNWR